MRSQYERIWDLSPETESARQARLKRRATEKAGRPRRKARRDFWTGLAITLAAWAFVAACLWIAIH